MIQWLVDLLPLPEIASQHAADLDAMLGWIHLMMIVLFIGWMAFFLYCLVRFRAARNPVADYKGVTSHTSTYLEGIVVVLEAVFLIGFSIPLWAQRVEAFPQESESAVVRVIAEQFAWNVHYAGTDGVFGRTAPEFVDVETNPVGLDRSDAAAADDITTINQLHLPVNKPALIHLTTKDVIHSFALQEMRVKQDTVPGISIPVWFVPTVTTAEMRERKGKPEWNYEIACAQLCGLGHYRMRGFMTIHTQAEYDRWLAEEAALLEESGAGEDDFWN